MCGASWPNRSDEYERMELFTSTFDFEVCLGCYPYTSDGRTYDDEIPPHVRREREENDNVDSAGDDV